jgi:hypothetical protein
MNTAHVFERGGLHAPASSKIAVVALSVMVLAAFLTTWAPVSVSIAIVFLFAGPHNWIEARYFLTRLPARWGKLRGFFLLSMGGACALAAAFAALSFSKSSQWSAASFATAWACWDTLVIAWIGALIYSRSRQNPRRDWLWTMPLALVLVAFCWIAPQYWDLALVYAHPLMAFWILDRELGRSRPGWRRSYRLSLACIPAILALVWWRLLNAPPLPGESGDFLAGQIARHAGFGVLTGLPSHLLVTTHTFLEMLHYSVWLAAIPLVGLRVAPWRLSGVPLARRSKVWKLILTGALCVSAVFVIILWTCFLADYQTTRQVYFTVAILHVLAEVPFLLRVL